MFYFECGNAGLNVRAVLKLDYKLTFDQENVDYLNSITSYWSITGLNLIINQTMQKN